MKHNLSYDLAEAEHTGCALTRSKHAFALCPQRKFAIKQAVIVLNRLSRKGHVFNVEDLDSAINRASPDASGQRVWEELHAKS